MYFSSFMLFSLLYYLIIFLIVIIFILSHCMRVMLRVIILHCYFRNIIECVIVMLCLLCSNKVVFLKKNSFS